MAARHAGSTRPFFLFSVPQIGCREFQSLREERFQGIAEYGGSYPLGQQRFHDGLRLMLANAVCYAVGKALQAYRA